MYPKILKKQSFNIVFIVMNPFPAQLCPGPDKPKADPKPKAETNQG
jgi:hypothetical protein